MLKQACTMSLIISPVVVADEMVWRWSEKEEEMGSGMESGIIGSSGKEEGGEEDDGGGVRTGALLSSY